MHPPFSATHAASAANPAMPKLRDPFPLSDADQETPKPRGPLSAPPANSADSLETVLSFGGWDPESYADFAKSTNAKPEPELPMSAYPLFDGINPFLGGANPSLYAKSPAPPTHVLNSVAAPAAAAAADPSTSPDMDIDVEDTHPIASSADASIGNASSGLSGDGAYL